ncbi:hypothetical protein C6P40_005070 [Pichia californica]|uniref:Zn(2)-C6 fungal-type domain-containing protein n=1 Tax=Pichia californica TaxID=460514 RepID=A0A9P6WNM6_9ASCO|nr:hypothetical protein C6P42_005365 [[Candida] californica]KAG0689422.1 hypothetical protein C6P40_005070 [[Candida] californica]
MSHNSTMDSPADESKEIITNHNKVLPNVYPTNSLILPDGKIFKVQKKRQRKIHSCIPCHQRKIRCSRETPTCNNCQKLAEKNPSEKLNILEACKYFDNDKKKNLKKKGVDINTYTIPKDNNQENFNVTPSNKTSKSTDTFYEYTNNDTSTNNATTTTTTTNINTNNNNNTNNTNDNNNTNTITADTTSLEEDQPSNNDENTDFSLVQNEFVYTPREEANEQFNEMDINYQNNTSSIPNNVTSSNNNMLSQQNSIYVDEQIYSYYSKQFASQFIRILNNLPTKERSDELLKNFQTNVHSLLPILDMNSFLEKYNDFWYCGLFLTDNIEKLYQYIVYFKDKYTTVIPGKINDFLYWYNKSNGSLNPSNFSEFLILLYAVYYTSISSSVYEFLSKKYDNFNNILSYKNEVNKYYNMYRQMNHKGLNNPRVMSLAVLQINVLVQSITNLKSGKSLINISKILRICQFYQLNRDPVLYHGLKDKELVQTRRIVWWQIFLLDNLVSFFLNLTPSIKLSDFDTSLLMENLDNDSSSNFAIMYLNCMFRFILIVDDLNGLTNGLNFQLKNEDINKMKNNINNLFITCNSTMKKMSTMFYNINNSGDILSTDNNSSSNPSPQNLNSLIPTQLTEQQFQNHQSQQPPQQPQQPQQQPQNKQQQQNYSLPPHQKQQQHEFQTNANTNTNGNDEKSDITLNSAPSNFHEPTLDTFKYFMSLLNILSDKMLIMLQKKILLSPYLIYDTYKTNSNLNLRLKSTEYSYTDLQCNLLPSLMHYLDTFLLLSKKDMLKFNWNLKNYIPIDELILLMQILATNFKSNLNQSEHDQFNDMNLKIYLIDETLNSLKLNWHLKLSSVNKLISLSSKLWELMILKFNIDLPLAYSLSDKYIFPKPSHEILKHGTYSRNINISSNSVSCAEIAPRSIGIASAFDTPLRNHDMPRGSHTYLSNDNLRKGSYNTNNGRYNRFPNTDIDMNMNVKERFIKLAKLVEEELAREGGTGNIQDTDEDEEGWFNLGTEEEYGLNSIDDFHFYKNLKSDVIRLFKLVVC